MKYNIRFFLRGKDSTKHADVEGFCDVMSEHIPQKGELVYLTDEVIKPNKLCQLKIEPGTIYRVLYSVTVYDFSGCSSIEVVLKKTVL